MKKMKDRIHDNLFTVILCVLLTIHIWQTHNAEATIIYVEVPQKQAELAEVSEPAPLDIAEIETAEEPEQIEYIEPSVETFKSVEIMESNTPETSMQFIEPRYGFTEDEIYLMTVLLSGSKYVDGDGEYDIDFGNQDNRNQIGLVLGVVMNRVRSDNFPDTVEEVIWASGQFSPMRRWVNGLPEVSDISLNKVREWCRAYDTYDLDYQTIPDTHLYFYGNGVINISREEW